LDNIQRQGAGRLFSLRMPSSPPLTSSSNPQGRLRRHLGRAHDGDPNPLGIFREP
jgi:hypothetical protein